MFDWLRKWEFRFPYLDALGPVMLSNLLHRVVVRLYIDIGPPRPFRPLWDATRVNLKISFDQQ